MKHCTRESFLEHFIVSEQRLLNTADAAPHIILIINSLRTFS
jgi:hypothetical protein